MDIAEKKEHGYLTVRTILEMVGKPKDHVQETIAKYVDHVKEDPDIEVLKVDLSDIIEKDDMFSALAELDILVKDLPTLAGFCFQYMPSSIEISEPESLQFDNQKINAFLVSLQAKLHDVDMVARNARIELDDLKKNIYVLLTNMIQILTAQKGLSAEGISKLLGVPAKDLEGYLKLMVKDGKLLKTGNLYERKK